MRVRASFLAAMALFAASGLVPAELAYAEVKIGAAGPLSGKYAWYGEQLLLGVQTAVAELNAKGGVLGQQVQVT
jgi:branched-chain amino acid transport system substrate-binding protein